jgi:hypothetical protein
MIRISFILAVVYIYILKIKRKQVNKQDILKHLFFIVIAGIVIFSVKIILGYIIPEMYLIFIGQGSSDPSGPGSSGPSGNNPGGRGPRPPRDLSQLL